MHVSEAHEHIGATTDVSLMITCEHASQRLPSPWRWGAADLRLVGTHWAYDIGAARLTRDLCEATGAAAILSTFTRLLVDPNRAEDQPGLFLAEAEGKPVELNRAVDVEERGRRLEGYWAAYHQAVDSALAASPASVLLSMHTFTPVYHGHRRTLELGVLFDREEALAKDVAAALDYAGFRTALNEPYSGKEGLIYSADRHARRHGRQAIEIEMRQDLAVDPLHRGRLVAALRSVLA